MVWLGRDLTSNFLKIVFHKFYLVYSWILCPIYCISSTQCLTCGYLWSLWLISLKLTLNLFSSIAGVRIFLWYIQIYLTLISSSSKLLTSYYCKFSKLFWNLQENSKFTGEHPCRIAISIKLQSSSVNLLHVFRTPFPRIIIIITPLIGCFCFILRDQSQMIFIIICFHLDVS